MYFQGVTNSNLYRFTSVTDTFIGLHRLPINENVCSRCDQFKSLSVYIGYQ